jgi:TRAP-type C4-dicarboxylate transport system permease small subunit
VTAKAVIAIALLGVLIFTLGQVFDRYVLKGSFNAYDQIARIALIWMTFIGAAMAFRDRTNIVVDLIDSYLPAKAVAVKAIALDALSLALVLLMFGYANRLLEVGAFQGVMGTPFTYREVYVALTIGSVLFILFLVARLVSGIAALVAQARRVS